MIRVILLILCAIAWSGQVTAVSSESSLTPENCQKIPGWTSYIGTPPRDSKTRKVSDEVANKSEKDLKFRTCCNYKNKCDVLIDEVNKGKAGKAVCTLIANCQQVDSGALRIERVSQNGWSSWPYCPNFFENNYGIPMSYCDGTGSCFQRSRTRYDLLTCLNTLFGDMMEHPGFFAESLFPYKEFSYKQRDFVSDVEYKLTKTGGILRNNRPFGPSSQLTPASA